MDKKKLLVYANYYYPEVASTAQIFTELCEGITDKFDVTVICAVPCYTGQISEEYLKKKYYFEEYNNVKVIRVRVPNFDKHNKKSRIKHILAYFFRSVFATFKATKPDYILTMSQPPILGGLLGVIGRRINRIRFAKTKLVYNIQDYNPEQITAVGYSKNKLLLKLMMLLDKHSCKKSDKVIVVGRDMVETMKNRFTKKNGKLSKAMPDTVFINNWINEKEVFPLTFNDINVAAFRKTYNLVGKFVIMYSGNIGLYYDLENLIKVIERFKDNEQAAFAFVGDGTVKSALMSYVEEHEMHNVIFIPYQAKEELVYSLNSADVHFVVNAKGIKGVSVPSKCYGVMADGKPIVGILESGSEARELIESAQCGKCCNPEDYESVYEILKWFIENASSEELQVMGNNGRKYLETYLTKDVSIHRYANEILALGNKKIEL